MEIEGAVAVVTGANRGIGLAFTRALLARGAAKVYAGVRDPARAQEPGVTALPLDVTDDEQIAAAAEAAADATIVVNNAGIQAGVALLDGTLEGARREMEVNYFGTWAVTRAFAPVLAANGGGALVNMLSVASWRVNMRWPGYAASKAAEWSLTNALRVGLRPQGTLVVGVHVGFVDTDATAGVDAPKTAAGEVAALTLDALGRDEPEVLVDEVSRQVRAALSGPVELLEPAR
ncbi:SDR family oxidoreductase [Streptomyces sp. NPDC015171]|uniref:SDR family oxidoreductase n=1 Tax=Streptomyces sp. NPDC015171 TaxID=3364945 RepID=UPI003702F599